MVMRFYAKCKNNSFRTSSLVSNVSYGQFVDEDRDDILQGLLEKLIDTTK